MKKYTYAIVISATNGKQADNKAKALKIISSKLTSSELLKLADIIANDPVKTQMAKAALGV